ncbi:hypothetical protein [Sinomonas sp. P10A9]|uniref:Uncharacterized protein n=1 Tax=Sinomonas puerhi TaxID=3238584 RepID=A0AB39L548_9MICC
MAAIVGLLVLTGCTPAPAPSPSTPSPSTPSPSTPSAPSKVFSDQELMTVGYMMLQECRLNLNNMDDSTVTRTAFDTRPFPLTHLTIRPDECSAFHPPTADDALKDLTLSFAVGVVPLSDETVPSSTIRFTMTSAESDRLAKADFDYTDELAARCAHFDASAEGADSVPQPLMLLKSPSVGDRAYAIAGRPDQTDGTKRIGLRVLAGTISISMFRSVPSLKSVKDAQPTLDMMAGVAKDLIHQAAQHPPAVPPPPANAQSPQQLTDLLQEITGPDGRRVTYASGTVIHGSSLGNMTPCTYSDGTYYSALRKSTVVHGEFPPSAASSGDAAVFSEMTVRLISMPIGASGPYPFDQRAADLGNCATIQEQVFTDSTSSMIQWSSIHRFILNVAADSAFAVAHDQPDMGAWHLLAGARRGTLTVELGTYWTPQLDPQERLDQMAAVINQIFAKAGV